MGRMALLMLTYGGFRTLSAPTPPVIRLPSRRLILTLPRITPPGPFAGRSLRRAQRDSTAERWSGIGAGAHPEGCAAAPIPLAEWGPLQSHSAPPASYGAAESRVSPS